jgi:hypothetical protein
MRVLNLYLLGVFGSGLKILEVWCTMFHLCWAPKRSYANAVELRVALVAGLSCRAALSCRMHLYALSNTA